jgi:hypothetical protein
VSWFAHAWAPVDRGLRYTGDALGGLINASLGNATEFIIVRSLEEHEPTVVLIIAVGNSFAGEVPDSRRTSQLARRTALQVRVLHRKPAAT